MGLTPKQKILNTEPIRSELERLCNQSWFHSALDMAQLQLLHELSLEDIPNEIAYSRLVGARDFISVLLRLHEKPREPKSRDQGLNHNV